MNKPLIALFSVAAVAAGGYSAVWFKKADELKQQFLTSVAEINTQVRPMIKTGDFFRYESVDMTGFPLAMTLSITKPVMQVPFGAILKTAPKETFNGEISPDFEWVEELSFGDSASLGSDMMGSKFTLSFNGDFNWKTTVGEQVRQAMVLTSSGPLVCELRTKPSGFLVSYPRFNDFESFFNAFEAAQCASSQSTLKNATTGAVLATTERHSADIRNVVSNGNRSAGLKYEIVNSEYMKEGDALLENYVNIIAEATKQSPQKLPYSVSEFGKNNMNINVSYDGPDNSAALENPNSKIKLDVQAINFNSSLFNSNNSMLFDVEPQGDNRRIVIKLNSKTNVSERYNQIITDNIKASLNDLAHTEGKIGKDLDIANSIQKFGSIDALVDAAFPKLDRQGDMVLNIDIDALGKKGAEQSEGQAKFNAFDIFSALYGIKLKGDFVAVKDKQPATNADIVCTNCDMMVDEISDYSIRFANYLNTVAPGTKAPVPSKELANGVKTFLHSVALNGNDPAAKDLNFNLSLKESGEFTVSGKPVMDAMQSYMTNVAPHLPQEAPPQIPAEQMPPEFRQQLQSPQE